MRYCDFCEYPHYALNLCEAHYARRRRGKLGGEVERRGTTPEAAEKRLVRRNRKATERRNERRRAA